METPLPLNIIDSMTLKFNHHYPIYVFHVPGICFFGIRSVVFLNMCRVVFHYRLLLCANLSTSLSEGYMICGFHVDEGRFCLDSQYNSVFQRDVRENCCFFKDRPSSKPFLRWSKKTCYEVMLC